MSSHDLIKVKSQGIKEMRSEALDGTMETSQDFNGGLNTASTPENTAANSDEPGLYHLNKKAKLKHAPISSLEESSDNTKIADSRITNSSIRSTDFKVIKILESSKPRVGSEKFSAGHQATTVPRKCFAEMVHGISDCGTSDCELPSPPAAIPFHSRYRKFGPSLMTLHKFTDEMNGNKPIYVPVYKRNDCGRLLKLVKGWYGGWEYMELKVLTTEEVDGGLKILEEPKVEMASQSSESKRAVGRRTLADFGLPETKRNGGWGWL